MTRRLRVSRNGSSAETSMRDVALFVEDFAHETFLSALVQRLSEEHHVPVALRPAAYAGAQARSSRSYGNSSGNSNEGEENCPTC